MLEILKAMINPQSLSSFLCPCGLLSTRLAELPNLEKSHTIYDNIKLGVTVSYVT